MRNLLPIKILTLALIVAALPVSSFAQCGGEIDFTNWTNYGANQNCNDCETGGVWEVFNSGKSVRQTVNGGATYFVSDQDFIDVTIHGTFRVNTTADDDWVGFVFGYKNPNDNSNKRQEYFLFDWKQLQQNTVSNLSGKTYNAAKEGFCLMKINDSIDFTLIGQDNIHHENFLKTYWGHQEDRPEVDRLDSLYGTAYGWAENTDISFSLTYTTKKIVIEINNDTIFDLDGCFEPGKFGFYNLSQAASEYKNFSYELIPDFQANIPDGCINSAIEFSALNDACQDAENYSSPIKTWDWEFAPGLTASGNVVSQSFDTPGTYSVKLTVGDGATCSTSVTKDFLVKGLILEAAKDFLCAGDNILLTATAITDAQYQWYKDGSPFQNTGTDNTLTITETGTYYVEISGQTGYACNTSSTEVIITDGVPEASISSSSPVVCTGGSVTLTAPLYPNAVYSWTLNDSPSADETNTEGNILTATQTGNYKVSIEAENGCTATSSVTAISAGTDPVVTISSDVTAICSYETANLSAIHDGTSLTWYRNGIEITAGTDNIKVSEGGTYTAATVNAEGCTATSSQLIIIDKPGPDVTISSSTPGICPGEDLTLTVEETGAASYVWQKGGADITGEAGQSLVVTEAASYRSIVTNPNNCTDTSTTFIAQNIPNPVAEFTASAMEFCSGETVLLTATEVTGATYEWSLDGAVKKSGASNTYSLGAGGEVSLLVTDRGCSSLSSAQTFTENALPAIAITSQVTSLCGGATGVLAVSSGPGLEYEWFRNSSSLGQNMDNSLEITEEGTYYAVADDGKCSAQSDEIVVSALSVPAGLGNISGSTIYCPGVQQEYSVPTLAGVTFYSWSVSPASAASIGDGQGTESVTINFRNPTGSVTLTCTPINECGEGTAKSYAVNSDSFCTDYIKFSADKTKICNGTSVTFTAHSAPAFGTFYRFKFESASGVSSVNGSSATVTFNQAGVFDVTLAEVDQFSNFETISETKYDYIIVNETTGSAEITGEQSPLCNYAFTYTVTGGSESIYTWQVPAHSQILGGQNSNSITVYYSAEGTGNIEASPLAATCDAIPAPFEVNTSCGVISATSAALQEEIRIFPSPASDFISISGPAVNKKYKVSLIDEMGETVAEFDFSGDPIPVSSLRQGVYLLKLSDKESNEFRLEKFIKY